MSSPTFSKELPPSLQNLKVALVHYWLVRRRGGEQVLEVFADMFPDADIFTLVLDRSRLASSLRGRRIITSFLQRIPGIIRHYQKFLPLFPLALESFDLDGYDLVISSESGPAKGVITGAHTCHVCYCHTPMRYLWEMYCDYRRNVPGGKLARVLYALVSHHLRLWDYATGARVDYFVANSHNVADRIRKTYRRAAEVVHPPVAVNEFSFPAQSGDFYLIAGQLIRYKRVDLAINACNQLGRKLVVIGEGEELARLRRIAGSSVKLMGWQPDEVLRDHYSRCRALLFPGEEDFGMTPVEAQASGRAVIALGRGGALETVRGYFANEGSFFANATGVFFRELSVESLVQGILCFEKDEEKFSAAAMQQHAKRFSEQRFRREMADLLAEKFEEFRLAADRLSPTLIPLA
jgi:glycosyltransferase involved in cell wall biosynthesis